jgi:hypothetical protein
MSGAWKERAGSFQPDLQPRPRTDLTMLECASNGWELIGTGSGWHAVGAGAVVHWMWPACRQ